MLYFVETRAAEQRALLCEWVESYYESGRKVQVLTDSTLAAQHLDRMLWTFSQSSFIPHRIHIPTDGEIEEEEPVIISVGEVFLAGVEALVCDVSASLHFIERYPLVVHFIVQDEPERLQGSRLLWQQAKEKKMKMQHVPYASNQPRVGPVPGDRQRFSSRRSRSVE